MKRLLIALLFCLFFSSIAHAGKSGIDDWNYPELAGTSAGPGGGNGNNRCHYTGDTLTVFARGRKGMELALQLVGSDDSVRSLYSVPIGNINSVGASYRPNFYVDVNVSWNLVWTLSSTKGKGRVLDAVAVAGDSCEP